MVEITQPEQSELLQVPEGLSAMFLPDFGVRNHWGDLKAATPEEVLAQANGFLQQLNLAGVDVIAVFPVDVDMGGRGGVVGNITETKLLLVLKK